MCWRSTRSKALGLTAAVAAAALAFLLLYGWAVYRVPVTDIYLPASSWSDEVVYSKQLAAVVQYGAPQGYFGFNESHAPVGTFAAWGPAIFWMYALPGLVLRLAWLQGLSREEIVALKWAQVDFQAGSLSAGPDGAPGRRRRGLPLRPVRVRRQSDAACDGVRKIPASPAAGIGLPHSPHRPG